MTRLPNLAAIVDLYTARGHRTYGEGVSQIEHAVQCAALAAASGAAASLVAAALLHDIGHLLAEAADAAVDARHEVAGAAALAGLFGPAVCAPIALHVAAKRYLCAADPAYHGALSPASRHPLALQGGAFDAAAAAMFARRPHAPAAIALRRFDDSAKRDRRSERTICRCSAPCRSRNVRADAGCAAHGAAQPDDHGGRTLSIR